MSYGWQKARATLQWLSTAEDPLPQRLEDSYFEGLTRVLPSTELPAELRGRHAEIAQALKRTYGERGSAAARLRAQGDDYVRQLADELFELCIAIAAAVARDDPEQLN